MNATQALAKIDAKHRRIMELRRVMEETARPFIPRDSRPGSEVIVPADVYDVLDEGLYQIAQLRGREPVMQYPTVIEWRGHRGNVLVRRGE